MSLKILEELANRTRLRFLVHEKKTEARERLLEYLRSYPTGKSETAFLTSIGLSEEKVGQLERVRAELMDMSRYANNDTWFASFQDRFQAMLDDAAEARVAYYARRVAISTAISPNALVDTLLTSYCGFMMIADLCRIYNLRVGSIGTIVLLGHVFLNAYVAGQLDDFEDAVTSSIETFWAEIGTHVGSQAVDAAIGIFVGKAGSRAVSGMFNYLLMKRLGRYAVSSLRPIQVS